MLGLDSKNNKYMNDRTANNDNEISRSCVCVCVCPSTMGQRTVPIADVDVGKKVFPERKLYGAA